MSTPKTNPEEPDYLFKKWSGTVAGKPFSFRELSVQENDSILESSKNPDGTHNGRLYMRMIIVKCSIDPKLTLDDLAKMPNRLYLRLCDVMNELNGESEEDEVVEGEEPKND